MNLNEFLDAVHQAEVAEVKRRCKIGPDPSESDKIRLRNKAPFTKPDRKKIVEELWLKKEVDVTALVEDTAEYVASSDHNIPIYLEAGEYNDEGILKSAAISLMDVYAQNIFGVVYDQTGRPHIRLAEEVDKIIKLKGGATKKEDGSHVFNPQEKQQLRDDLANSLIDVDGFIEKLEQAGFNTPTGQYL